MKGFISGFCVTILALIMLGAIPSTIQQREYDSYQDCSGVPCRLVTVFQGQPQGPVTYTTFESADPVSCTTTSSTLLAANTARVNYTWMNKTTTRVYVCRGTDPCTVNAGLPANQFSGLSDSDHKGILTCITESSTAQLYVSEVYTN